MTAPKGSKEALTQIFFASLAPYELGLRLRRHFVIGHYFWSLAPVPK